MANVRSFLLVALPRMPLVFATELCQCPQPQGSLNGP